MKVRKWTRTSGLWSNPLITVAAVLWYKIIVMRNLFLTILDNCEPLQKISSDASCISMITNKEIQWVVKSNAVLISEHLPALEYHCPQFVPYNLLKALTIWYKKKRFFFNCKQTQIGSNRRTRYGTIKVNITAGAGLWYALIQQHHPAIRKT